MGTAEHVEGIGQGAASREAASTGTRGQPQASGRGEDPVTVGQAGRGW